MTSLLRGSAMQRLRLASGLILFAFALTHFLNTALGIVSLEAMLAAQELRIVVTRSWIGTAVLATALLIHVALALGKIAARGNLALKPAEWLQVGFGLAIPLLLLPHIVSTRGAATLFGVQDDYAYELARLWPGAAVTQSLLLILVWVHGCLGLHYWLRVAPWYPRWAPILFAGAVLVPVLALSGFMVQGREVADTASDPIALEVLKARTRWPDTDAEMALAAGRSIVRDGFYAILALVLAVVVGRMAWRQTRRRIPVEYVSGPLVQARPGLTLLEISRANGVPHLSVCGGRARCSTCRVRVVKGMHSLSPPTEAELATLRSIDADADVRLACQTRPRGALTVLRLMTSQRAPEARAAWRVDAAGVERDFAVLFVDIRGFTAMSEQKLAYDVVFILNRVFQTVGVAIESNGGRVEKYMGDGLLALFESRDGLARASANALLAAAAIDEALDQLNAELNPELSAPIAVAMGMHAGRLVVGKIGWGEAAAVTVVGPTVNVASRLESVAKAENRQLALSRTLADAAGSDVAGLELREIQVKGVAGPLQVILVGRARDLRHVHIAQALPASPLALLSARP